MDENLRFYCIGQVVNRAGVRNKIWSEHWTLDSREVIHGFIDLHLELYAIALHVRFRNPQWSRKSNHSSPEDHAHDQDYVSTILIYVETWHRQTWASIARNGNRSRFRTRTFTIWRAYQVSSLVNQVWKLNSKMQAGGAKFDFAIAGCDGSTHQRNFREDNLFGFEPKIRSKLLCISG